MMRPSDLPKSVLDLNILAWDSFDKKLDGWYPINSIAARDCKPSYRNAGGGIASHNLMDLPSAIDQCILNIQNNISSAQFTIRQLEKAKELLKEKS